MNFIKNHIQDKIWFVKLIMYCARFEASIMEFVQQLAGILRNILMTSHNI